MNQVKHIPEKDRLLLIAFLCSGFAALGYELMWTRLLALALGNESMGVSGVLMGFFGGMALGAWLVNKRISQSPSPVRLFAILESVIIVYACISPFLFKAVAKWLPVLLGPVAGNNHSIVALIITVLFSGLMLLPATACMGATLVALTEARKRIVGLQQGRGLARLYAANTLGAALGIVVTVYLFLPAVGFVVTAILLASASAISVLLALIWEKKFTIEQFTVPESDVKKTSARSGRKDYVLACLLGLAGIGVEIAAMHLMAQVLENTIYTFANILTVYLAGTFTGAWYYQRKARGNGDVNKVAGKYFLMLMLAVAWCAVMMRVADGLTDYARGNGMVMAWICEWSYAALALFPVTIFMGFTFSWVIGQFEQADLGKAYALNTVGGSLASIIFGVLGAPLLGFWYTLYLAMAVYAVVHAKWFGLSGKKWVAPLICAVFWVIGPHRPLFEPEDQWKVLFQKDGHYGTVVVSERPDSRTMDGVPERRLQVNRHFRMGGGASYAEKRMGHFSMLLAPEAKEVLFLGIGTGATLGAVVQYPVASVDAVELVPEVTEALEWFDAPSNNVRNDHRVHILAADARRYVAAQKESYDLIVADLFHPGRDGAGNLFSLEHFQTLRKHLNPDGVAIQWVPLHQFDTDNLKVLIRTFLSVFEDAHAFLALYNPETPLLGLVGFNGRHTFPDHATLDKNLSPELPGGRAIRNARDFWAAYMGNAGMLTAFAGEGPLNTDLKPYILFHAPDLVYKHGEITTASVTALMKFRTIFTREMVGDSVLYGQSAATFAAAQYFMDGQIQSILDGTYSISHASLPYFLKSYQADPDFAPAVGKLMQFGQEGSGQAEAILPYLQEKERRRLLNSRN
ncbi:MAG: hypothetical protein KDD36_01135 [Flavobacteriales bacterium]|nr:hypothetical protein [Flavobacteriales bacterium]